MDSFGSSNECDEGEQKESEFFQREFREQDDQLDSKTNIEYLDEIDVQSQPFQKHDNQSKEPFIEYGGFEPFTFPFFMLENKNETIFQTKISEKQLCPLETSKGGRKKTLILNNEIVTELDENQIQKSTQNLQITATQKKSSNKRLFKVTFMPIPLNYQPGEQTKFYLFADRVVDIKYLRNIFKNLEKDSNYTQDQNQVCIFKGNKLANKVFHRIDNKCIEVIAEEVNKPLENFEQIIQMLLSLGDQNLFEMANNLLHFQNNITKYKNFIKEQSEDTIFQLHKEERETATNEKFQRITSKLEQDQYIHYIYFKVDYENKTLFNYLTGYNPKFYELVAGNAYAFKESLLRDGYYDPIYILNRLNMCLNDYLSAFLPRDPNTKYFQLKTDYSFNLTKTLDGFLIPAFLKRNLINLSSDYDTENKLNFKVNDFLAINVFQLIEDNEVESIESQLRDFRKGQKYSHESDQELKEIDRNQLEKQFKTELFLQKYYHNNIDSLMEKGNKWFKQCGVVDIPNKKRKEQI